MSKSAVDHIDVRWRVTGTQAWSGPRSYPPTAEIAVDGLERGKDYDFEARNVSACGATSVWVPSDYTVPAAPDGTLRLDDLNTAITTAQARADAANNELAAIASDAVLSPGEKPVVIRDNAVILTEQTGIDAQATAFGIATEKTAYDDACSALSVYLAGLLTPVAWNNLDDNTDIDGPTFRGKFADVYTTRQTLLNAIYAAAKAKADAAQGTANDAQGTANSAIDQLGNLSNSQYLQNPFFTTGDLTGWTNDSDKWYFERGANGPASGSTSYAVHGGSTTVPGSFASDALRNSGRIPVYPGAVLKAQCSVRGLGGADGSCGVRISWRDASDTEISTSSGNLSSGNVTNGTYATGTAPAGAMFAHVECAVYNHTIGYYTVDNFAAWALADSMDQVPDSATRFAAAEAGADKTAGKSLTVLTSRTLDNIGDSATYLRTIQHSAAAGALTIDNAAFQLGNATGWTATNAVAYAQYGAPAPAIGNQYIVVNATAANGFVATNRKYACSPGDKLSVGGLAYAASGTAYIQASFYQANGTYISSITAATASAAWIAISASGVVPANAAYFQIVCVEVTSGGYALFNYTWCSVNDIRVAGSGATIGDQRNAPSSLTRNLGIVRSATALTAQSTGAVSVNAHTITLGSASIGYNAVSNAVTGLTQGSSYYIYTRDNYAGGSPTWLPSSDSITVNSYDDAYNAGVVTIPTSGSSGGGTGGGAINDCVGADVWLRRGLTARQLAARWRWWRPYVLRGQDGWHFVRQRPRIAVAPSCRITVADGSTLDCSNGTPVNTATGESVLAPMLHGHFMWTDSGWQRVINVDLLPGEREVVHISVGGHTILAGACCWRRLSTHNVWKK